MDTKNDAAELKKLEKFASDEQSLQHLLQIKKENKHQIVRVSENGHRE